MDGRDDDVRGVLATLLEAEPPMRSTVADDVHRGRALRARRHRRLAGSVAAVVVLGLGVGLGVPRILTGTTPHPVPPATAVSPQPSVQGEPSEVPAVVEGEVARAVLSDAIESHTGTPDAAITYVVQAACTAPGAGGSDLTYELRDDSAASKVLSSGSVPCDGTVVQNSASPLPTHRLSLTLVGPAAVEGWAVLVPYPSLAEQQEAQRKP